MDIIESTFSVEVLHFRVLFSQCELNVKFSDKDKFMEFRSQFELFLTSKFFENLT